MKDKLLSILPEEIENFDFNQETEANNFILIYFIKKNNELFLNNQKPIDFSNDSNEETVIKSSEGDYRLRVYSNKGDLLEEILFDPSDSPGFEILAIPNYLNIGQIELTNLLLNKKENLNLNIISVCNENGICEANEENLCPLDCPSANNPNYPFITPKLNKIIPKKEITTKKGEDLIITTKTQPNLPPKNYFYQILTFSLIGFTILFLIFIILLKKRR